MHMLNNAKNIPKKTNSQVSKTVFEDQNTPINECHTHIKQM
jgi:hypothetical protein